MPRLMASLRDGNVLSAASSKCRPPCAVSRDRAGSDGRSRDDSIAAAVQAAVAALAG